MAKKSTYNAKDIEVLEGLEPVRKRPGMYIGSTNQDGLHHLVNEVLDNSIDEVLAGHATDISFQYKKDGSIKIKDNQIKLRLQRTLIILVYISEKYDLSLPKNFAKYLVISHH